MDCRMDIYWLEQTTTQVPEGDHWLSVGEAQVLRGLRFAKRRADWRLGRWTAKNAVAMRLGAQLEADGLRNIEIRAAASGAPEVFFEGERAPISISLSHRAGLGACAVGTAGMALGCDLEFVEPHSATFAADYFSAEEQELVAAAGLAKRDWMLALLWSAKESALKALQEGLRLDTRSVIVSPGRISSPLADGWNPLRACCSDGTALHGWWHEGGGFVRTVLASSIRGLFVEQDGIHHAAETQIVALA
jgi:4'-phosphopantetheinyl transferase